MPRFFIPKEKVHSEQIIIENEDAAHIGRVLRSKIGDVLTLCDSAGHDYIVEIESIERKQVVCRVKEIKNSDTEPELFVTLFQGVPKGAKMDYIIQKTTELGISRIVPCILSRCVSKPKDEEKKVERWQKIALEAAKQSGRGRVPEITMPMTLEKAILEMKKCDIYFAPYECEDQHRLRDTLHSVQNPSTVGFMIGPEGGFDLTETTRLHENEIQTVTLGKRILRTETAGVAVLSMLMYEIGDMN